MGQPHRKPAPGSLKIAVLMALVAMITQTCTTTADSDARRASEIVSLRSIDPMPIASRITTPVVTQRDGSGMPTDAMPTDSDDRRVNNILDTSAAGTGDSQAEHADNPRQFFTATDPDTLGALEFPGAAPMATDEPTDPGAAPVAIDEPIDPGTAPMATDEPTEPGAAPVAIDEPTDPGTAPVAIDEPTEPGAAPAAIDEPIDPGTAPMAIDEPTEPGAAPVAIDEPIDPGSPAPPPAPAATAVPPTATPRPANTPIPDDRRVAATDPAIRAEAITFPNGSETIMGYLARPSQGSGPWPAVLVCHENRDLTAHIEDVVRRFAKSGYVALGVDLLSRAGGTKAVTDDTQIPGLLTQNVQPTRHVGDFQAGLAYLKTQAFVAKDKFAMTGYCFGGGMTWLTASMTPDLKAIAPHYGPTPADAKVAANIKAQVLGVYASTDPNLNARIPELEAALKEGKVTYEMKLYPDSQHAFHNDTNADRFQPAAAKAAWTDTLALFDKVLKS